MDRLPVVEMRDLSISRDGRRLLSGMALDVKRGSVHLLVGPNGAGKSTLFGAVLGLIEFRGTIRFHWRGSGRIGYVPQSFAVDPEPELLLLDEPASGLDEMAVKQFEDVVVALKRGAGTSVLMVSHDLRQVRRIADRVTLLDQAVGRTGSPTQVLADDLAASLAIGGRYDAP